jgi:hypothetical protein
MNLTRDKTNLLMQPRGLSKTTSYSSKLESKNTRRQTKGWTQDLFAEDRNHQHVIRTSPLRNLELPSKSQLKAGSLSTAFLTPLISCFFPCRGETDLHKLFTAHHNLGSSRVTPSHLGGFTSKSNKCHEDCFTKLKWSNHSQRGISSLNPNLDFSQITQTSQRGVGESSQKA